MTLAFQICLLAVALALAVVVSTGAQTATNAVHPLSLADAKLLAFERNWDLLAAKSGVDSATAQLLTVTEFPNPTAIQSQYQRLAPRRSGGKNRFVRRVG